MSSPLFLQLYRTLSRVFNRVSDGLILELDAANTSSYTGANGSVTDGSTFTNLGSGVNSNFQLENNTGNLVAYIESTPKYISAKPYDVGYLVSGNTDGNKITGYNVDYIVQSVRDMTSAVSMNNDIYRAESRTIEWWGRVTAPPGDASYIAPGAVGTFTYNDYNITDNTRSFLYSGSYRATGGLILINNGDDTFNIRWEWDDSPDLTNPQADTFSATTPIALNTWSQIVTVLSPAPPGSADPDFFTCDYYINGQYAGSTQSDDVSGISGTQIWYIGRSGRAYANNNADPAHNTYFSGLTRCDTSIFRQYNRALTANEIRQNYNAERSKFRLVNYNPVISNPPPVETATYIITADGASNTRRDYDAAQASTGFNGSAWVTQSGVTRAPQPGDVIEFADGTHGRTRFLNFEGTSSDKYTFRGPSTGQAIFRKATSYVSNFLLDFNTCKHFIVDGESTTQSAAVDGKRRNIKLMYPVTWDTKDGTSYLKFNGNDGSSTVTLSHNCTIRYVEIDGGWSDNNNFFESTGLGIATNDSGSLAVDHPGLYQENIIIEHCYIRNIPGEGMYIGSNYETDSNSRKTPVRNITVRHNRVENTGVEGIGAKCWFSGTNAIHDNYCINNCVSTYNNNGKNSIAAQACSTDIYNNFVFKAGQSGIGIGNNYGITPTSLQPGGYYVTEFNCNVYNNVIVKTGLNTTFFTNGSGIGGSSAAGESRHVVHAFNNTIANVTKDGIQVDTGFIRNNIVVFYGLLATDFVTATDPGDATNNYTNNTPGTYFVNQDLDDPENGDWRLVTPQTAVGTIGVDISATDIVGVTRDATPQVGAYEYIN